MFFIELSFSIDVINFFIKFITEYIKYIMLYIFKLDIISCYIYLNLMQRTEFLIERDNYLKSIINRECLRKRATSRIFNSTNCPSYF